VDDILEPDQGNKASLLRSGGRNVFQVIWQRRALVLLGLVLGTTIGVLTYAQRPPVYRTNAQVLVVKKQGGNVLQGPSGDPRMAMMDDYVATHMIVIRSPYVIAKAVEKKNLGSLKSLQGRDPVGTIQAGLVAAREANKDGATGSGNNILNLSYTGSDPGDVQVILRSVIASYQEFLDQTYQDTSAETVELIQSAVTSINTTLKQKSDEYRIFRKESPPLMKTDHGIPFYETKILEYEKKRTECDEQAVAINNRIRAVQKSIDEKQPQEVILSLGERRLEKGLLNQNREKKEIAKELELALVPLLAKEADLSGFYGKDHPDVLRIRKLIEMTRESRTRIEEIVREGEMKQVSSDPVQNMMQVLKDELRQAELNRDGIKILIDQQTAKARELENYYQREKEFLKEIAQNEKVLALTQERLGDINRVRDYGGFNAKLLAEPGSGGKTSPVLWQFLLMGAALGFAMATGSAYLLDVADKSFRNPEEIRRRLGLPIVGHVPYVMASTEPVMTLDGAGNPVELDPGLIALHQPMSPAAEGFRGIRTALYFNTHGQRHNVIQVTSPNMGDGKTTLITNLAVSIAQSGRKVLIVDADLRRPRVHRSFGLTGKVGLAEVIAGTAELDEAIQITVVPNLSVLPCGRRPQNPAELLTTPRFEDVIDDLRSAFDYVLVDTPPLLAVSDPCIVAPRVDGLLLTIRLSKNGRPAAERARDLLAGLKTNIIGVVVNGVGKHGSMTGYGYEHYRYADEYMTAYTTTDEKSPEVIHDAPNAADPSHSTARADAKPFERALPTLADAVEPSANGHSSHSLKGE
jgi:succinoglycan biosynthesis transport protein ExoP